MGIFDFFSKNTDKLREKENLIEEINSLNSEIMSLNSKIEERQGEYDILVRDLSNIEDRINFAVFELANIESEKKQGSSISIKENPTKEEMDAAVKENNIRILRYSLAKSWMDKYEQELEQAKSDLDSYIKEKRDEIRLELIDELYQRANHCETSMLRYLASLAENANIEAIRNQLKLHKHIIKEGIISSDHFITGPTHSLFSMCEKFIQVNISNIVQDMKNSDWETIKMRASTLITNVQYLLFNFADTRIDDEYLNSVYNFLEAKYLAIQKQEIEKEKEREEREAQREYQRAIKKAQHDEEKAIEALEKKRRELAEEQTQERIKKLQEQITGLEKALSDAKELRERALSMAQQTKSGYVYVISNIGSFGKDVYKIGMTRRLDPMERVMELSNASVPFPFDVHTFIFSTDAPALEAELHRVFDRKKINSVNIRKEYFRVTLDEIKEVLKERGVHAEFIDEPDAFQYRECLLSQKLSL